LVRYADARRVHRIAAKKSVKPFPQNPKFAETNVPRRGGLWGKKRAKKRWKELQPSKSLSSSNRLPLNIEASRKRGILPVKAEMEIYHGKTLGPPDSEEDGVGFVRTF